MNNEQRKALEIQKLEKKLGDSKKHPLNKKRLRQRRALLRLTDTTVPIPRVVSEYVTPDETTDLWNYVVVFSDGRSFTGWTFTQAGAISNMRRDTQNYIQKHMSGEF